MCDIVCVHVCMCTCQRESYRKREREMNIKRTQAGLYKMNICTHPASLTHPHSHTFSAHQQQLNPEHSGSASNSTRVCLPVFYAKLLRVQDGCLPLHTAVANNTGLDVVKALLQAYKHAAEVADEVCVWSIMGTVPYVCKCGTVYVHAHAVCICEIGLQGIGWRKVQVTSR